MTIEEFKNGIDYPFFIFAVNNKSKTSIALSEDKSKAIYFVGDEKREYEPYEYIEYLFLDAAFSAKENIAEKEQVKILMEGKADAVMFIERTYRIIEKEKANIKYDFSSFLRQFDSEVAIANFTLQTKLLDNQIETNNNTRNTNTILKAVFIATAIIYLCQLFVSLGWIPIKVSDEKLHIQQQGKQNLNDSNCTPNCTPSKKQTP